MPKSLVAAGILAVMFTSAPGLALADSTLTLVVAGEGFDGPPKFTVSFDGKPLGESAVASAIDTSKDGRFADAVDKAKYTQTFSFKITDEAFKPDGAVAIKLTNEAHGAAGSKDDRELYVQSVAINGNTVPGPKLAMRSSVGIEPKAILGDYLVISQSDVEGIATAPDGGWPKSAAPVAETPPVGAARPAVADAGKPATTEATKVADAATAADSKPATDAAPAADSKPAPDVAPKTDVAEATPPKVAAATTTDVADSPDANPNPEANLPDCGVAKSFQITGFSRNSNELTPKTRHALDVVAKTLGTQKCAVNVKGYSSMEGDTAHNALFSIERARNALQYLAAQGVKFRKYSANGVGETSQFGADPNANRRVVVVVSP